MSSHKSEMLPCCGLYLTENKGNEAKRIGMKFYILIIVMIILFIVCTMTKNDLKPRRIRWNQNIFLYYLWTTHKCNIYTRKIREGK